jgi:ornithine decarboxylase
MACALNPKPGGVVWNASGPDSVFGAAAACLVNCVRETSLSSVHLEFCSPSVWKLDLREFTPREWEELLGVEPGSLVQRHAGCDDPVLFCSRQLRVVLCGARLSLEAREAGFCPLRGLARIVEAVLPGFSREKAGFWFNYVAFSKLVPASEATAPTDAPWDNELAFLTTLFDGCANVLGMADCSLLHVFAACFGSANPPRWLQVHLSGLDTNDAAAFFGQDGLVALEVALRRLHQGGCTGPILAVAGNGSAAVNVVLGSDTTWLHASRNLAGSATGHVATSAVLTHCEAERFVATASQLCRAATIDIVEIALRSAISPARLTLPGYKLCSASTTRNALFGARLAHYKFVDSIGVSRTEDAVACEVLPESVPLPTAVCSSMWGSGDPAATALSFLRQQGDVSDHATALLDLSSLDRQLIKWRKLLPRVKPFYSVKCNSHLAIVQHLWKLYSHRGAGFDCATPAEIALVRSIGVPQDRIVFANPCKQQSAIDFARDAGVQWMTFDNAAELDKIKRSNPRARLLLHVQTDDAAAQCPLSNKFGTAPGSCHALLAYARQLDMRVEGVTFHVGSGCAKRGAFRAALGRAKHVFDMGSLLGFDFTVLDIGGGFAGLDEAGKASFAEHAEDIRNSLESLFPDPRVEVIAEPGRFFAAQSQTLVTTITSVAGAAGDGGLGLRYYINDGIYGSFNCLMYDHAETPHPIVIRDNTVLDAHSGGPLHPCTLFGPTCDGLDRLAVGWELPLLRVGDKLVFANMGAYTSASSTTFNGFPLPATFVFRSRAEA